MPNSEFEDYLPRVGDRGELIESQSDHFDRVSVLLSNFPKEVLAQWIYEHWSDVSRFDWLDFPKLKFTQVEWTTEELLSCGAENHEMVALHKNHYEAGIVVKRTQRIAAYMARHGTWPVPPLLIENTDGKLGYPGGGAFTFPFHPIEGQHRIAVFLSQAKSSGLQARHKVWHVTRSAA